MKYESLKEFIKRIGKSKSTINRFYKANPDLKEEIKEKGQGNKKHYPLSHAKYFSSELMFEENKLLLEDNRAMKNLIDCLMVKDSLPTSLCYLDWSFFVTVAYKHERNKKSCYRLMSGVYSALIEKYGVLAEIRMVFNAEPNSNRDGYHNHFALYVSDKTLHNAINSDIQAYFNGNRIEIEPYDKYKAGIHYISKGGLNGEDWDILGNRLGNIKKAA